MANFWVRLFRSWNCRCHSPADAWPGVFYSCVLLLCQEFSQTASPDFISSGYWSSDHGLEKRERNEVVNQGVGYFIGNGFAFVQYSVYGRPSLGEMGDRGLYGSD